MAEKKTTSRRSTSRGKQSGNGSRPAERAQRSENETNREFRRYQSREEREPGGPPDVLLDVPELRMDLLHFELDDLDAHLAVKAKVLNLIKLNVGIDVHLSRVKLDVKGVELEALLKARLDHVTAVVDRLMTSLDRNPELVEGLSRVVAELGQGAGEAVDKTGDAAKEVGKGAEGALQDVGKGAGQSVGDVGEGAGQAVGDLGQGAGQAAGGVGQAAGQSRGGVGDGVGQVGQAAGGAHAGAQNGGGPEGSQAPENGDGATEASGPGGLARVIAKTVAREIRDAASDEARDLGLAATRKVKELGERREQRRAEKYKATDAALRLADELGVDLAEVRGTGSGGRITVKDVQQLQSA